MIDSTTSTLTARDGLELFTRHWPAAEPRATVILVHGIAEHSGRWEHVGSRLAHRGFDTHAYDWRGYGRSGGPRGHADRFELMVDDLEDVMTAVRAERPLFVYAHSGGGLIATAYATSGRPQPRGFVLSAPALKATVPAPLRLAAKVLTRFAPTLRMKSPIKGEQLSRDPSVGEEYFADPLLQLATTARLGAEMLVAMDATRDKLDRIRVPVLVIHGAEDRLVPPEASAPLGAVPSVRRTLYPGVRHELHNEPEQEQVMDDVVVWMEGQLSG
jgi:alpha-beta hydrolase superfamily lysophospholipase